MRHPSDLLTTPDDPVGPDGLGGGTAGVDHRHPDDSPPRAPLSDELPAARQTHPLRALDAFLADVAREPYRYDLFQVLRRVEALTPHLPRLGRAWRPADEPLRLAQDVSMAFAPSPIAAVVREHGAAPRLSQHVFGLLGPNGPLPLHLTDFARERLLHVGDATFARFLDMLTHRQLALFYRAWAQARPTNSLDRPGDDRFATYVGALMGLGDPTLHQRDAAPDHAKLYFSGAFSAQQRRPEGLAAVLTGFFQVPVAVEPFSGHWMCLPADERLRLAPPPIGRAAAGHIAHQLGGGAVLGRQVWDRQHHFRIRLGPLTLAQYTAFLPGGTALSPLVALVRQYQNRELAWDAQLVLRADAVPQTHLGRMGRLGYTTWLGRWRERGDADPLTLAAEDRVPMAGAQHDSTFSGDTSARK